MKVLRALLLMLALSVCAYADGNIPYGRDGNIPYGKAGEMPCGKAGTTDLSTEIAVYLLQSVLPLF
jgi:hypothetical protein